MTNVVRAQVFSPSLGSAEGFGVLSGGLLTFHNRTPTAPSPVIIGDLGYAALNSATEPFNVTGTIYANNTRFDNAYRDAVTAIAQLESQPCTLTWDTAITFLSLETVNNTMSPGVFPTGKYCGVNLFLDDNNPIELRGPGAIIFYASQSIGSATGNFTLILTHGMSPSDVWWQVSLLNATRNPNITIEFFVLNTAATNFVGTVVNPIGDTLIGNVDQAIVQGTIITLSAFTNITSSTIQATRAPAPAGPPLVTPQVPPPVTHAPVNAPSASPESPHAPEAAPNLAPEESPLMAPLFAPSTPVVPSGVPASVPETEPVQSGEITPGTLVSTSVAVTVGTLGIVVILIVVMRSVRSSPYMHLGRS